MNPTEQKIKAEYKPVILNPEFSVQVTSIPNKMYSPVSDWKYYLVIFALWFALFLCLFGLFLDLEWMAGLL